MMAVSEDRILGNESSTYRGDQMHLTLDCEAEIVEVFRKCEDVVTNPKA